MPDHRGKFALTYKGPYVVKNAFSRGALILANMDGHDLNMPTNSDAIIRYFAWRSLSVHLISIILCQPKKKKRKKKCKKVDQKPKRAVYAKGEPKERGWENIKGRLKTRKGGLHKRKAKEGLWESLLDWEPEGQSKQKLRQLKVSWTTWWHDPS